MMNGRFGPHGFRTRVARAGVLGFAGVLALGGCQPRLVIPNEAEGVSKELGLARERVDTLERRNSFLERRISELEGDLDPDVAELLAFLPRPVAIEIDDSSRVQLRNRDVRVRIRLRPIDRRGRFVPVVGHLVVELRLATPDGRTVLLGERTLDSEEFEEAWRGGMLGRSVYLVEWTLPDWRPQSLRDGDVAATVSLSPLGGAKPMRAVGAIAIDRYHARDASSVQSESID